MAYPSPQRPMESALGRQFGMGALSVLVFDPEPFQRKLQVRAVESLGVLSVHEASSRSEAVQLAAIENVDLMICGADMSGIYGLDMLSDLGEISKSLSMILTGTVSQALASSVASLGRSHGINLIGVLEKPVATTALQEVLERHWSSASPLATRVVTRMSYLDLVRGVQNGELLLHYQPTVTLKNGALVACEALLRWNHPELGLLEPSSFLAALDHEDLAGRVTLAVTTNTLEALRGWMKQGLWLGAYVNLSAAFLSRPDASQMLREVVAAVPEIEPRLITFDVTEEALVQPTDTMLQNLHDLWRAGFGLALDNYAACTTYEQLRRVPFTDLKLNPSLLIGSSRRESVRELLDETMNLARRLDLAIVAEGVERGEDWALVASLGCHLAQGYLIAKPMPPADFAAWAARQLTADERPESTAGPALIEPVPVADPEEIGVGSTLGHYRLDRVLGQGGLGKVFLATDTHLLRPVALKVCLDKGVSAEAAKRFVQEARALARVQHPGVVTIYEIGMHPCHYIVMEVLEGRDLQQILAEKTQLDSSEAITYMVQVLEALQAVHTRGIVHRDLKPSNLMLDGAGRMRIMDFGIAKIVEDDPKLTQAGHFCGTPQYMAPEQVDESIGALDERSDLFSMGTIFYEMLTGRNTVTGSALTNILSQLLLTMPPAPHTVDPSISPKLSDICMKALNKAPAERYQNAASFLEALRALNPLGL